jgi:hypothetical protein
MEGYLLFPRVSAGIVLGDYRNIHNVVGKKNKVALQAHEVRAKDDGFVGFPATGFFLRLKDGVEG